jgi:hypothetical protein
VKDHLRIVDGNDDSTLAVYLAAALEFVETETRQQLCHRDYLLTLDTFPGGCQSHRGESSRHSGSYHTDRAVKLPKLPLVAVASVEYTDAAGNAQTVNPATYAVDTSSRPGRIVLKPGQLWPQTDGSANCVGVTFTAGYSADGSAVPVILQQCILLLVGHYFENREGAIDRRIDTIPLGVCSILNQQTYPEAVG